MPGFFVDRQDYGGFANPVNYWDNTLDAKIPDIVYGIAGVYDFWGSSPRGQQLIRRPLMTLENDPCCCPELFCCFPETITATVEGFQNATRVASRSVGVWSSCPESDPEFYGKSVGDLNWPNFITFCSSAIEDGSPRVEGGGDWDSYCCPSFDDFGRCSKPNGLVQFDCVSLAENGTYLGYFGTVPEHGSVIWPESMFPPKSCTNYVCCGTTGYVSNRPGAFVDLCAQNAALAIGNYYYIENSTIVKEFDPLFMNDGVTRYYTWSEISSHPVLSILASKPNDSNIIYGAGSYSSDGTAQIYDGDHNGTYVCHKLVDSLRPELEPYIQRQNSNIIQETTETRAVLLYEVEYRRNLSSSSNAGCSCGLGADGSEALIGFLKNKLYPVPTEAEIAAGNVPGGNIYCVDYPCGTVGRVLPLYLDNNLIPQIASDCADEEKAEVFCDKYQCIANQGFAKPHLTLREHPDYPVNGEGAEIRFDILAEQHDQDTSFPVAWKADNFTIAQEGSGYIIGDTFIVDFDPAFQRTIQLPNGMYVFRGGQFYPPDPKKAALDSAEFFCTGQVTGLRNKYGLLENDFQYIPYPFGAWPNVGSDPHPAQTVRVIATGELGEIREVERVPWFKINEYGEFCEAVSNNKKTPLYPLYTRSLCHPNPVSYGGRGYSVGDKITWNGTYTNVSSVGIWKDGFAEGYVTDVGPNGEILDWFISGGINNLREADTPRYFGRYEEGAPVPGHVYNKNDFSPCYGSLSSSFYPDGGLPLGDAYDNRGYYYDNGTRLCSLAWRGVGVPIRSRGQISDWENSYARYPYPSGAPALPCNGPMATATNNGYLTEANISVSRINAETSAGLKVNKYRYIQDVYDVIWGQNCNVASYVEPPFGCDSIQYIVTFAPFPECIGGGAEVTPNIIPCTNPIANKETGCGNESLFGGSLAQYASIKNAGAYYGLIDRVHDEPILPTIVPRVFGILTDEDFNPINTENDENIILDFTIGEPATIGNFSFDKISNFPHPDILYNPFSLAYWTDISYTLDPDRFAFFPLTNINIDNPGSGYFIGAEFDLYPVGGSPFTKAWEANTGDDPIVCESGGWYEGEYVNLDNEKLFDYRQLYTHIPLPEGEAYGELNIPPERPIARVRITDVDNNGGILSTQIISAGMMFRSVETDAIIHPDVSAYLDSTLGYGAIPNFSIVLDKSSSEFGKLNNFWFSNPTFFVEYDEYGNLTAHGGEDPLHSVYSYPAVLVPWGGSPERGYGRDYANPDNGYFWILNNIVIGGNQNPHQLLAYYPYGDHFNGVVRNDPQAVPYNYLHPEKSTHTILEGSPPPYVPKSTICSFDDCYHSLLNRTYPMFRIWVNANGGPYAPNCYIFDGTADTENEPYGNILEHEISGRPSTPYVVYKKNPPYEGYAHFPYDYTVVEYGYTITLNSVAQSRCPDHRDGRTADGSDSEGYTF